MIFPADFCVIDNSNVERYHSILLELRAIILRSLGTSDPEDFNRERELLTSLRCIKKALAHCDALLRERGNASH